MWNASNVLQSQSHAGMEVKWVKREELCHCHCVTVIRTKMAVYDTASVATHDKSCQLQSRKYNYRGAAKPEVVLAALLCRTFSLVVKHVCVSVIIHSFYISRYKIMMERKRKLTRHASLIRGLGLSTLNFGCLAVVCLSVLLYFSRCCLLGVKIVT